MNTNWGSCDGTATHGQALAYGGDGHCAMALPSDPKNKKCINDFRQCILSLFGSVYQNV